MPNTPVCPLAKKCGGCQLQNLSYPEQLHLKQATAIRLLGRFGHVEEILGMDDPYHYRNKAILPIGRDESGNIVIGFYASRSHRIIDMDSCAIQSMDIKPFVQAVKRLAESTGTTVYDEVKHCGSLRQLMLRRSLIKGDIMAVLVIYCLREGFEKPLSAGIPLLAGTALVFFSYRWKHNTLLSIALGTAGYMLALRLL